MPGARFPQLKAAKHSRGFMFQPAYLIVETFLRGLENKSNISVPKQLQF